MQLAFAEYDRQVRIRNSKLGSVWAMILMPAGFTLDLFVYPAHVWDFLAMRVLCSLCVGVVWALFQTPVGQRYFRALGMIWYLLPGLFISWMIYASGQQDSPYYAGLNIVLIGAGFFLPWTWKENLATSLLIMGMYLGFCRLIGPLHLDLIQNGHLHLKEFGPIFNNLYFLTLTGLIVTIASYYHSQTRYREFELRFELDRNKKHLEEANRKLVELDEVKSRFFANISHELRTPLTLLLAPMETLLQQKSQAMDAQARDWLLTMQANGLRLLKLINDLLDLVRLESGKMDVKREPVSIADFLKGLANSVRKVADDKRVRLNTVIAEDVGTVITDRDKLEKVVLNLTFNAIKFTSAGGLVEIRAEKKGEELILQVVDTGMGISTKNLPYIFTRFWQADTSSHRKYQGTGIGLALVKELVEVQNGTVAVASQEGKGTTMTVKLPYLAAEPAGEDAAPEQPPEAPAVAAASEPARKTDEWLANLYRRAELYPSLTSVKESIRPVETTGRSTKPKVLIADDEPDMLRFLKSQLSEHYQILEAVDGQQAVEKAAQFLPDVILCDMMMPEKDGLQVCRELRSKIGTENIPIVLLTARADEETKLKGLSDGASDFLTKPFSTTELHVRLRNLISSHELQRRIAKQNQVLEATLEQLKDAQAQLVQSEKMVSLGRMSAGIIHEINNPLNYAKTGLYTLRKKSQYITAEQKAEYEEILKDVEEGVNRVKNIVSDLRTFTHPNAEQFERVEIKPVVTAALRFLNNEWRDKVAVHDLVPEEMMVEGNRNKLVQVLVNLVQNAIDALAHKKFGEEKPAIWIEGKLEAGVSKLIIRDNGEGIKAENLERIYDPFFTTKDVGQGMGLGLSICYRIIQEHGGWITVKSEPGKFCEFTLEFPVKVQH